jgi:hypothetical protein
MNVTAVDYGLWALAIGLEAWLVGLIPRQRFPALFAYVGFELVKDVVLIGAFASGSYGTYYYAYWTLQVVGLFLQGWVMGELIRETGIDVKWVLLALVGTCLLAVSLPMAPSVVMVVSAVQRAVYFVRAAVFVLVALEYERLGKVWMRIAAGIGLYAGMELLVALMRTTFGVTRNALLDRSQIVFFLLALVTWVTAFVGQPKVLAAGERK